MTYEVTNADGDIVGEVARTYSGSEFTRNSVGPLLQWTASLSYAERSMPSDLRALAHVAPRHFDFDEQGLVDAAVWVRLAWDRRRRFVADTTAAAAKLGAAA